MSAINGLVLILIFIFGILVQPILWFISLFVAKDKTIYYHHVRRFVHHECDCDSTWYESFSSEVEFQKLEKFLLSLFQPIGQIKMYSPKPKVTFWYYEYGAESPEGGFIYSCKNCNQLWEMVVPDNANRGYFKGITLNQEEIGNYLGAKNRSARDQN